MSGLLSGGGVTERLVFGDSKLRLKPVQPLLKTFRNVSPSFKKNAAIFGKTLQGLLNGCVKEERVLSPDLQQAVPASGAESSTVIIYTKTRNPVDVAFKRIDTSSLDGIPSLARVVIITGEEVTTRDREGDRGDTDGDRFLCVHLQFSASADIEQARGRVVGTGGEGVSVGEEADSVDVALVSRERLRNLSTAEVPQLGSTVTSSRNERLSIRGESDA